MHPLHARLPGRLVVIGFGSIGQGVMPLLFRHLALRAAEVTVIAADARGRDVAAHFGVTLHVVALTEANHREVLVPLIGAGDFVVNLSVGVSSVALVRLCHARGALYLDTVVEPWAGFYHDGRRTTRERSNYALRETMLALRDALGDGPTALIAHGANPGLVSHWAKEAALAVARRCGRYRSVPSTRSGWAALFAALDVRVVHVTEYDTQASDLAASNQTFVGTWSIDGLVAEACQASEVGWGTHERRLPPGATGHEHGCGASVLLATPGAATRLRSRTPHAGAFTGFLMTHNEVISLADHLTVRAADRIVYRPTVCYVYRPCDATTASLRSDTANAPRARRLMMDEIVSGFDELGVCLMSGRHGTTWLGSRLSIDTARRLAPFNNATSLQVAAGVLAGIVWCARHPRRGIVEAEDVDHAFVLDVARPYLGRMLVEHDDNVASSDGALRFESFVAPLSDRSEAIDPFASSSTAVSLALD